MSIEARLNRIEKAVIPDKVKPTITIVFTDNEGITDKKVIEMRGRYEN